MENTPTRKTHNILGLQQFQTRKARITRSLIKKKTQKKERKIGKKARQQMDKRQKKKREERPNKTNWEQNSSTHRVLFQGKQKEKTNKVFAFILNGKWLLVNHTVNKIVTQIYSDFLELLIVKNTMRSKIS